MATTSNSIAPKESIVGEHRDATGIAHGFILVNGHYKIVDYSVRLVAPDHGWRYVVVRFATAAFDYTMPLELRNCTYSWSVFRMCSSNHCRRMRRNPSAASGLPDSCSR
jgi:hypothetical protein